MKQELTLLTWLENAKSTFPTLTPTEQTEQIKKASKLKDAFKALGEGYEDMQIRCARILVEWKQQQGRLYPPMSKGEAGSIKKGHGKSSISDMPDISKMQLERARKLAVVPEATVNRIFAEAKDKENRAPTEGEIIAGGLRKDEAGSRRFGINRERANDWYTPVEIIEAARKTMGGITLDPASSLEANEVVKADMIFTEGDNGLKRDWYGKVWLNPPFVSKEAPLQAWVDKVVKSVGKQGEVEQLCLLLNCVPDTNYGNKAIKNSDALFLSKGRLKFMRDDKTENNTQTGQMVMYYGQRVDDFYDNFISMGVVLVHYSPGLYGEGFIC